MNFPDIPEGNPYYQKQGEKCPEASSPVVGWGSSTGDVVDKKKITKIGRSPQL